MQRKENPSFTGKTGGYEERMIGKRRQRDDTEIDEKGSKRLKQVRLEDLITIRK